MAYWIYSSEAMPNPELMGRPGYTPDNYYIKYNGVALSPIPAKKWMQLPESFPTIRRRSWKDPKEDVEVPIRKFQGVVDAKDGGFSAMGVIMLDHEPSANEKKQLEAASYDLNMKHRKRAIEFYEQQVKAAEARQGTYPVTPYIDECYHMLNIKKPYSVEAMQAQRDPGAESANKIAEAISAALKADRQEAAMQVAEALTAPQKPQPAATR